MDRVELAFAGVARQAELIRAGEVSSRELTETLLERIGRLDPTLNAFRIVLAEQALAEAEARDSVRKKAERGPLHGVPVAIKDEYDVAGEVTEFGGIAQRTPVQEDGHVTRCLREAGAVIIGKTNMPEFGAWPFTESAAFGYTRNPWDTSRTPGGSSGGSAVAVAAGMVGAALGGDSGGSIRIPSACCGLFGLKPQRGRVSLAPFPYLWHALSTGGPIARRVTDSALVYDAARHPSPIDRYTAPEPSMTFTEAAASDPGKLRIAVSSRAAVRGVQLHDEQRGALESTAETLRDLGHEVAEVETDFPDPAPAFFPQYVHGVREEAEGVDDPQLLERRTRQLVGLARLLPRASVPWAIRRGEAIARAVDRFFEPWDLLLTPAICEPPRPLGALDGVSIVGAAIRAQSYVAYMALWNVAGNPAASVPAGQSAAGLPLAVQLVGPAGDEPTILQLAAQLEQAQPWTDQRPPVS